MVFRILAHPEAERYALFRMAGRTGNEQQQPHIRSLSVRIGRGARLAGDLARLGEWKGERALLPFVGFELPDRVAQWIHSRDHSSAQRRRRAGGSDIEWAFQELGHRFRYGGMHDSLLVGGVFPFRVACLRVPVVVLEEERLAVAANVIR